MRIHAWVNQFIKNCCEDEEHKLKGVLTLSELSGAEEYKLLE